MGTRTVHGRLPEFRKGDRVMVAAILSLACLRGRAS